MVHFALEAAVTELRFPHCPAQRAAGSSGPAEPAHRRGTTIAVGVVGDSHTPFLVTLNGSCQRPHKGRMSPLHQFPGEQAGHTPCACHGTRPIGATPKPSSKGPSCSQVRQPGRAWCWAGSSEQVSGQWGQSVGAVSGGWRPRPAPRLRGRGRLAEVASQHPGWGDRRPGAMGGAPHPPRSLSGRPAGSRGCKCGAIQV